MIIRPDGSVGNILAATIGHDAAPVSVQNILYGMDWLLAVAGLALLVLWMAVWIARGRRDPLATAPARPNRVREDAVLITFGVYLVVSSALSVIPGAGSDAAADTSTIGATAMILSSVAQIAGAMACLFVARSRFDGGIRAFLFHRMPARHYFKAWGLATLLVLGLCPLIGEATVELINTFAPGFTPPEHPTLQALRNGASPQTTIALWIGAGLVAPVAEELFFRGLIQTWLVHQLKRRWLAILTTSIVFGLVHIGQPQAVPALVALSIILGFFYERTGAVAIPVLIHAAFNLKTLTWHALGAFGG